MQTLRNKLLAKEEHQATAEERAQLAAIRGELERCTPALTRLPLKLCRMREQTPTKAEPMAAPAQVREQSLAVTVPPVLQAVPAPGPDALRRMMEERSFLIDTGVYTEDDRIIRELDARIQQAVARHGPAA